MGIAKVLDHSGIQNMFAQQLKSEPSTEAVVNYELSLSLSQTTSYENQLMAIPFFEAVKRENGMSSLTRLAFSMNKRTCTPNEIIYDVGAANRQFAYILKGTVQLLGYQTSCKSSLQPEPNETNQITLVATLNREGYFGHSEFMNGCRIVRAVSASQCLLITVPLAAVYMSLRGLLFFPDLQEKLNFLRKVSLFESIDAKGLQRLVIASDAIPVRKGCKIYQQGTPATHIYVVLNGTFEIMRKVESSSHSVSQDVHISCVSEYQTLGAEDLFLQSRDYSETVHCISFQGTLLKVSNEQFTSQIQNRNQVLKLCKSRENWKRSRVEKLEKTFSTQFPKTNRHERILSSASLATKQRTFTEPVESFECADIDRCLSRYSHLTSKKGQPYRNEQEYLNHKYQEMQRVGSAAQRSHGVFELKSPSVTRPTTTQHSRNMSELTLTKFLNKKNKLQNRMIFEYLKTRPPELIFNANKEFAIFKPLHITESAAVRNQKRSAARIKSRYFRQLVPNAS